MDDLVKCPVCEQVVENGPFCEICNFPWPGEQKSQETIDVCRAMWQFNIMDHHNDVKKLIYDIKDELDGTYFEIPNLISSRNVYLEFGGVEVPIIVRRAEKIKFINEASDIVNCSWGEFNNGLAKLCIKPKNPGIANVEISTIDNESEVEDSITIKVYNFFYGDDDVEEQKEILFADFIVKANVFKCNDYHDIEEITATVNVLTPFGDKIPVTVDAGYFSTCDCYFILTHDYEKLRQQGVPLCRVIDEEIFRTKWHLIKNGMDLNEESVLHQYGYSVNQKDNLSDIQRREILSKVIDEGLYTVPGLKSFLDWLIERARKARNRNMDSAIEKWQSDRNWIAKNLSSPERDVEIGSIYKKTYL